MTIKAVDQEMGLEAANNKINLLEQAVFDLIETMDDLQGDLRIIKHAWQEYGSGDDLHDLDMTRLIHEYLERAMKRIEDAPQGTEEAIKAAGSSIEEFAGGI